MTHRLRRTARGVFAWGLVLLAVAVSARTAGAVAPDGPLEVAPLGRIVDLPGGRGEGEVVRFDARLAGALLALPPEEGAQIADWPVAPGVRRRVRLTRHEVYAEGARVFRVEGPLRVEIPHSSLAFFWGADLEGGATRVLVVVDPASRALRARVHAPEGTFAIEPEAGSEGPRHLLAAPETPHDAEWRCGQEDSVETSVDWGLSPASRTPAGRTSLVLGSLYKAILAVDTDKEYLASFSNNTTAATSYIATLVASINMMYERDLNLRLVVGTTILRVGSDPWTVTGSGASFNQLNEFSNYWNSNYPKATYPRSFAAMFSGKSTYGLSGIAWLASSVCGNGSDYSFNQISAGGSWSWGDTLIVGHEIGHNMGSPHTHCYAAPKPDVCYNGESCYTGATACPAAQTINGVTGVLGTIMGYCHMLSGCNSFLVFHPYTISRYVGPTLESGATGACIVPVGGGTGPVATNLYTIPPCRIVDTRSANGPLGGPAIAAGATRSLTLTSTTCSIPSAATAVSLNVTVADAAAKGNVTIFPGTGSTPGTNTLSFNPGQNRANNILVGLSGGVLSVTNSSSGTLNLILDVDGYAQ